MAVTAAALQAALGTTFGAPTVLQELAPYGSTLQYWLVNGGTTHPGRCKMLSTTASDNAATQATAVVTALGTGPA